MRGQNGLVCATDGHCNAENLVDHHESDAGAVILAIAFGIVMIDVLFHDPLAVMVPLVIAIPITVPAVVAITIPRVIPITVAIRPAVVMAVPAQVFSALLPSIVMP